MNFADLEVGPGFNNPTRSIYGDDDSGNWYRQFRCTHRLHQMLPLADSAFPAIPIVFQNPELWREVQAALRDLLRWWGSQPPQLLLAENAMERALLLSAREHGLQNQLMSDDRVQRAVAYIENRLGQDLSVATMAGAAGLSPTRFAHLFREMIGLAPMKFLELKRIERAKHLLLTTNIPIQQIGRDNGYPNAQHFSIRFRKVTGQSPSDFREAPKRRSGELETKPN